MAVGDFNTVVEDVDREYTYWASSSMGFIKFGEPKKLNYGIELECETIMQLSENFGLGIGTGYYQRSNYSEFYVGESWYEYPPRIISLKPEFTAIPITLTFYYFLPLKSFVNLYLNGGIGYYFGKTTFTLREDFFPYVDWLARWNEKRLEAKDQGLGLHGGVGLEFNVISKVAFFIEGNGIYCTWNDWKENIITEDYTITAYGYSVGNSDEESGHVWYYEEERWDRLFANFTTSEVRPNWGGVSNVKKFEWNLSGLSLRGGIRIRF